MDIDLSIIVPVYDEEKIVEKVIRKLLSIDYGVKSEIIVVNDGSTDRISQT
jgi:glycosyltransferase involved in cell wall biosynthesis